MNQNNNQKIYPESDILKMAIKIMERYDILDFNFSKELAIDLYNNGIKLDKFQESYYHDPFNLDEIILYLKRKKIREKKIITIKSVSVSNESLNYQKEVERDGDNPPKIIPYPPISKQLTLKKNYFTFKEK